MIKLDKNSIGKSYKTRCGRRAIVVEITDNGSHPVIAHIVGLNSYSFKTNGSYDRGTHNLDIISEWSEPRTVDIKIAVDWVTNSVCIWDSGYFNVHDNPRNKDRYQKFIDVTIIEEETE